MRVTFRRNFLEFSIGQYACFLICLLLMAVVPIARYHKIFGADIPTEETEDKVETITVLDSGETVINTTEIGKKIVGYSGPTPVEIYLRDGKIEKIRVLENHETPEFLGSVINSDLLESLDGMTLEEASKARLDAVSGATYTSNGIIGNIKQGVSFALDSDNMPVNHDATANADFNLLKFIITIVVILGGAIVPLFFNNKRYRIFQLILNTVVLGLWGGTFICYSLMVSFLSNGIGKIILIPVVLMLVTAFIYPMFGKTNHYCLWLCPYGSIQELAGKIWKKKFQLPVKTVKALSIFRNALWFALMWLLWTGLWMDWMGYEPFAAFFFTDASPIVLGIAGGFLILSIFIQRPYCRFVCPTGTLFKLAEGRK